MVNMQPYLHNTFLMCFLQIGFCFAQEGFKITEATKFTREPLKSMINDVVTDGLFFGISAKLPADCKDDTFCAFCVKLFGENTHIEFYTIIKKTMIKIAGRIVKRPEGSNKGKFRLSKIELFMEVSISHVICSRDHLQILLIKFYNIQNGVSLVIASYPDGLFLLLDPIQAGATRAWIHCRVGNPRQGRYI